MFFFSHCCIWSGVFVSRKIKNEEDWFVAGRILSCALWEHISATIISTVSVVGYMGYYYIYG